MCAQNCIEVVDQVCVHRTVLNVVVATTVIVLRKFVAPQRLCANKISSLIDRSQFDQWKFCAAYDTECSLKSTQTSRGIGAGAAHVTKAAQIVSSSYF